MVPVEVVMSIHVTLPYDPNWSALQWAKRNCPSYITNDVHMDGYNTYDHTKIDYFFGNKKDAVLFTLKYGQ
jgi:hypothetical protein